MLVGAFNDALFETALGEYRSNWLPASLLGNINVHYMGTCALEKMDGSIVCTLSVRIL